MKTIFVLWSLTIFLMGCTIHQEIAGVGDRPDIYVSDLDFEDHTDDEVYATFKINNQNESARCSVRITLVHDGDVVSRKEYPIGILEERSSITKKVLVEMPSGETTVNVEPLCNTLLLDDSREGVVKDSLSMIGDEKIVYSITNYGSKNEDCIAYVTIEVDEELVFEKRENLGTIKPSQQITGTTEIEVPSGTSRIEVTPICGDQYSVGSQRRAADSEIFRIDATVG